MDAGNTRHIDNDANDERPTAFYRPRPDGELDPAGEAGWYLQRERERRGETIAAAGAASGVHPYHVEAIEEGDLTRLPARLEALEMVGNYAHHLGFDPDPLVSHYAEFLPAPRVAPAAAHPANPQPLSSAKVITFADSPRKRKFSIGSLPDGAGGIVASCLGAVLLFAAASWTIQTSEVDPYTDEIPTASTDGGTADIEVSESPLPDDQSATVLPGGQTAMGVGPLSEEEAAGAGLDGLTAFIEQTIGSEQPGLPQADKPLGQIAAAGEPLQTPDGRVFGSDHSDARLVLKAKAPVWVRIEDSQGSVVMTQMLMAGDSYRVPNREGLVVIARDGGLLSYSIDGRERGLLGTAGEILVGRPLDIETLEGKG